MASEQEVRGRPNAPRYAPPNEQGQKPYHVTINNWGRMVERIVYADNTAEARYSAVGRSGPGVYVSKVRRATPADLEALHADH